MELLLSVALEDVISGVDAFRRPGGAGRSGAPVNIHTWLIPALGP